MFFDAHVYSMNVTHWQLRNFAFMISFSLDTRSVGRIQTDSFLSSIERTFTVISSLIPIPRFNNVFEDSNSLPEFDSGNFLPFRITNETAPMCVALPQFLMDGIGQEQ